MASSFLALINRLKTTYRWSGMHVEQVEDVAQHTFTTAIIAHLLCLIEKEIFHRDLAVEPIVIGALYHDVTESILTDVIAPIKKYDDEIAKTFDKLEGLAAQQMLDSLPDELRAPMRQWFKVDEVSHRYVKAADKLDALCRATLEVHRGNHEFGVALQQIRAQVDALAEALPCVAYFVDVFLPSFSQSVDEYWYLKK